MHFQGFRERTATVCLALALAVPVLAQQAQPIAGGNPALPLVHVENGENSAAAQKAHYVVLVSLDGFRWDYAKNDHAVNLLALGKKGVWAPEGMMPSYPSLTFPNHFTIVTGLYPEHHGLVANSFYDETKHARYAISDAKAVHGRKLVQRGAAVEPGGEPGDACGVPVLAGFGGGDRGTSADVVRGVRQQDAGDRRSGEGADRRCRGTAEDAGSASGRTSSRFTTPSPIMRGTSSGRMRRRPRPPR